MRIASSVEIDEALQALSVTRPVFHSEADFQLALAWKVQRMDPAMRIRMESRPSPGLHLDIAFARPDLGRASAVELKFFTRLWTGVIDGELYELKGHGAGQPELRRGKDIVRVEHLVTTGFFNDGAVLVLTNDGAYWRLPKGNDTADAAAFRTGEGVVLSGRRNWVRDRTGTGTERAKPPDLLGRYELHWADYSTLPGGGVAGKVRQLVVPVGG